jgi:hypothetical protein
MPREIHTSSVTWYTFSREGEAPHNHQFVRTLRIRQTLGLDYPTAASTSPSHDTPHRSAGPLDRVFMHFGGPPGPMETDTSVRVT